MRVDRRHGTACAQGSARVVVRERRGEKSLDLSIPDFGNTLGHIYYAP